MMVNYSETHNFEYKGNNFRSKLAAKWAVFFDAMGIIYEYEPECIELSETLKFIPTFKIKVYTPNYDKYVDYYVKVTKNPLDEYQMEQIYSLVRMKKESLLLLEGPPDLVHYLEYFPCDVIRVESVSVVFDDTKYGLYITGGYDILEPDDSLEPSDTKTEAIELARKLKFNLTQKNMVYSGYLAGTPE